MSNFPIITYPEHQQLFIAEPNSLQGAFFVPTHPHLPWGQPPQPHSLALLPAGAYPYSMLYPTPEYIYSMNDDSNSSYSIEESNTCTDLMSDTSCKHPLDYSTLQEKNAEHDNIQMMVVSLAQILKDLYRYSLINDYVIENIYKLHSTSIIGIVNQTQTL